MSKRNALYECGLCGNIVQLVRPGKGQLVCCNKPMEEVIENTKEAATEKHIPVIEKTDGGVTVKVGSVEHPMLEEHYIEWIELHSGDEVYRKHLKPSDKPEAFFKVNNESNLIAKEYCNIHGYWSTK